MNNKIFKFKYYYEFSRKKIVFYIQINFSHFSVPITIST